MNFQLSQFVLEICKKNGVMSKFAIKGLVKPFDLLLIFLCSLIQTLTLTPPPNSALLASMDMRKNGEPYPPNTV